MKSESVVSRIDKEEQARLEKLLAKARQDEEVLAVFLFGSVVREEQTHLSDIDICLLLVPISKSFEPTILSRKRLDYLKDFPFDIQIFQQLPLYIRRRVLKEGRILFVRDEALLYELAFHTAQAFEDFRPFYLSYLEEMRIAGS
jgi:predicted nucleotidyltransferase